MSAVIIIICYYYFYLPTFGGVNSCMGLGEMGNLFSTIKVKMSHAQLPSLLCSEDTGTCSRFGQSEAATHDLKLGSNTVKEQPGRWRTSPVDWVSTLMEKSCVQANKIGGAAGTISAQISSVIRFGGLFLSTWYITSFLHHFRGFINFIMTF